VPVLTALDTLPIVATEDTLPFVATLDTVPVFTALNEGSHCQAPHCHGEVFIACPNCLIFLCHDHASDPNDSCALHNQLLSIEAVPTRRKRVVLIKRLAQYSGTSTLAPIDIIYRAVPVFSSVTSAALPAVSDNITAAVSPQPSSSAFEAEAVSKSVVVENCELDDMNVSFDDSVADEDYAPSSSSDSDLSKPGEIEEYSDIEPIEEEDREPDVQTAVKRRNKGGRCEEKKGRKRIKRSESWASEIRKVNRDKGLPYKNKKGKDIAAKVLRNVDCSRCKFQCASKISDDQRLEINKHYYSVVWERKKAFICSLVKANTTIVQRRGKGVRPKTISRAYYLPGSSDDQKRVCQKFFCATLVIGRKVIEHAIANKNELGEFISKNLKKGKAPPNKTADVRVEAVRKHIRSFAQVESHYCRAKTSAKYLSPGLSICELYRLYRDDFCISEKLTDPVSKGVYRRIFVTEFNLRFFVPKKDQCSVCNAYYGATGDDKESLKPNWEQHKIRENESMSAKESDKAVAKLNDSIRSITFDLQAVLPLPFAGDNKIFYLRKLAVYNFTIYETSTNNGFCYLWDETEGKRGANEINTALLDYMKSLPSTVTAVTSFSDTCSGQNRNQFIVATMLYAVRETHLQCIDLKYMESGHSYLEADSMHSSIENIKRHQKVYTTREYEILITAARKNPRPYSVKKLTHEDFFDSKLLCNNIISNRLKNTDGEAVNWLAIKWLRFEKIRPTVVQYKYSISSPSFLELDVQATTRRGRQSSLVNVTLQPLYNSRLPIAVAKKKDLDTLVKTRVIPPEYAQWYASLPSASTVRDSLPEPAADEPDEA